jgi:hypothetical protein
MVKLDIDARDSDEIDPNLWAIVQAIGVTTAIVLWGIVVFVLAGIF